MYNEYPDLIYEGLISDSFYTDIVEEGLGESIKNGFGRLKEICKKTFDKIIEKLKQFVGNVRNYITKLFNKFKKKDTAEENGEEDKKSEDTTDSSDSGYNRNARNQRKRKLSGRYNQSEQNTEDEEIQDNSEYTEPENTTDSSDSGYNRNARNQRKRKLNGSYSDNHKKVKVVSLYNIDFEKVKNISDDFAIVFSSLIVAFNNITKTITLIEKSDRTSEDKEYLSSHNSSDIDDYVEDNKNYLKGYPGIFDKTNDEILSELISNYGTKKDYEQIMEKNKTKDFCSNYQSLLFALKSKTDEIINMASKLQYKSAKVFDILDKKLKHSTLNKSNFTKEEKKKLKSYRIAGNKAREQYQKVIRFYGLFNRLLSIITANIASIRVVEITD